LESFERMSLNDAEDVFDFNEPAVDSGNCRACLTELTSPRRRLSAGEFTRGGRGGGDGDPGVKMARGGGGSGPAVACTPG